MTIVGDAYVRIRPDDEGFEKDAEGRVTGAVKKIAVAAAGAFAATKIFDLGKDAWAAAVESQKIAAQTEAVIKSTGSAAGVTAAQVGDLAEALSKKNTVDDEAIQSGANLLLTFKNIKNEAGEGNNIFDRTNQAMIDMAAAMGTDVSSGAIQLGKALNDPVAGISALSRVGITFSEDQKKVIKSLVDTGKTADAQKIILAELESQFGGSAAAQATAADRLKITLGNLQEEIGAKLIPVVEAVSGWLGDNLPGAMEAVGDAFNAAKPALETVGGILWEIISVVGEVGRIVAEVVGFFVENWDKAKYPIIAIVTLIALTYIPQLLLTGAIHVAVGAIIAGAWVAQQVAAIASTAASVAQMVIQGAKWVWLGITATAQAAVIAAAWLVSLGPIALVVAAVVAAVVAIIANWDKVKDAVAAVFNWVKENWPLILAIITGPIGLAVLAVVKHWDTIKEGFTAVKDWIATKIGEIVGFFTGLPGRLKTAASGLFDWFTDMFRSAFNGMVALWNSIEFKLPKIDLPGPLGSIGGQTIGLPDLPRFHQGGVVPGQPTDEFLALLRGGETILAPGAGAQGTTIAPVFHIEQSFGPGTNADDVRQAMAEVAQNEIAFVLDRVVERAAAGVGRG